MAEEGSERGQDTEESAAPIDRSSLRCSFCGKADADVETIVWGPTPPSIAICNERVELCTEFMAEQRGGPTQAE